MFDQAIEKVGGRFRCLVLLQKRVRELVKGAAPLVPAEPGMTPIDIALCEVLADKITFGEEGLLKAVGKKKESAKERKTQ